MAPLWAGSMPPLTDFGGHLQMAACALARRCAVVGHARDGVLLALVLALTFFAHAFGPPLAIAMAGCVLVVSARTLRRLAFVLAFAPAGALWMAWLMASRHELGLRGAVTQRFSAQTSWDELLINTIDLTTGSTDMAVFAVLVGAWVVLLATSVPRVVSPAEPPPPVLGRAGGVVRAFWLEAREHALLLVGLGLLCGYFFVAPGYVGDTFISPRLVVPAVLLLFMAPRVALDRWLPRLAIAVAVVATFVFAWDVRRSVDAFERRELAPIVDLLDAIPPERRVLCAQVFRVTSVFIRSPLNHGCNGLVAFRTRGFADGGFAHTPYNAVALKDGHFRRRLEPGAWQTYAALGQIDYVVVRGEHLRPPRDVAARVDEAGPSWWAEGATWTLYRVNHPEPVQTSFEARGGGRGGVPLAWNCPPGMALSGVIATTTPDGGMVGSLQPRCRALRLRDDGRVEQHGRRVVGPRYGGATQHGRRVLECPVHQVMVGLYGLGGRFVDHLGVICGEGRLFEGADDGLEVFLAFVPVADGPSAGGRGGDAFRLLCPEDSVPVGVRGGFGLMIDSAGVVCGPALGVVGDMAPDVPWERAPQFAPGDGSSPERPPDVVPGGPDRLPSPHVLEPNEPDPNPLDD